MACIILSGFVVVNGMAIAVINAISLSVYAAVYSVFIGFGVRR